MPKNHHGFSLIELVIVILIIGTLAIMPLFNWPGSSVNVSAQAEAFANDIRYTQTLAMSKQMRYYITQTSSTTYQIRDSSTNTPIILANGATTMTLNSGIIFASWGNLTNNLVEFNGRGTPYLALSGAALSVGTTYQISLTGGGVTKNIVITPQTGKVTPQ